MFYDLVEIIWKEATVSLKIAELLEGEPDGCVGLPLVIDERSKVFEVTLSNVYEFKSVSEPFFHLDGERQKVNNFVWEAIGSEYRKTAGFYGPTPETARHFIIFTETLVFEVLSNTAPIISLVQK